jgi:hypothetical protein
VTAQQAAARGREIAAVTPTAGLLDLARALHGLAAELRMVATRSAARTIDEAADVFCALWSRESHVSDFDLDILDRPRARFYNLGERLWELGEHEEALGALRARRELLPAVRGNVRTLHIVFRQLRGVYLLSHAVRLGITAASLRKTAIDTPHLERTVLLISSSTFRLRAEGWRRVARVTAFVASRTQAQVVKADAGRNGTATETLDRLRAAESALREGRAPFTLPRLWGT